MKLTLWDYELLPTLIYVPSLLLISFLAMFALKTGMKNRFFVASTFAGFIGFAISFVLPFYEPLRFAYMLVPIAFFILCAIGILGCILLNTNPFDVKTPLFAPKPKKSKKPKQSKLTVGFVEEIEEEKPFQQTLNEAFKLLDLSLFKLGQPYHYYKALKMPSIANETIEFPFVVTCPNGIFLIYPCNWSGEIQFSDMGARKTLSTLMDSEDIAPNVSFREVFFTKLLDTIGLRDIPLTSVICATNPSAILTGMPSKYITTDLGDLANVLKRMPKNGKTINQANLFDIENAIELNQIK